MHRTIQILPDHNPGQPPAIINWPFPGSCTAPFHDMLIWSWVSAVEFCYIKQIKALEWAIIPPQHTHVCWCPRAEEAIGFLVARVMNGCEHHVGTGIEPRSSRRRANALTSALPSPSIWDLTIITA